MADFCNQCAKELGLWQGVSDYPDFGALEEGEGWLVICEECGFTRVDRKGNCIGEHSIKNIKHKPLTTSKKNGKIESQSETK
jgi:hypothetical protein